jgi:hypothetical protein
LFSTLVIERFADGDHPFHVGAIESCFLAPQIFFKSLQLFPFFDSELWLINNNPPHTELAATRPSLLSPGWSRARRS